MTGRLTVEPFGVILRRAEWRQDPQAPVNGGIPSRKVHGCSGIQLPAGCQKSCGIVLRTVGAAGHATDLIMDLRQVIQLRGRQGETKLIIPHESPRTARPDSQMTHVR